MNNEDRFWKEVKDGIDGFFDRCQQAKPGETIRRGSKCWEVIWIMRRGAALCICLQPISASADSSTSQPAGADAPAIQRKEDSEH